MYRTHNDDNGSLYTGDKRLDVGALVQIAGEPKPRRVTYVMGSERKGWRACFKHQGAVPIGEVTWNIAVDDPTAQPCMTNAARPSSPTASSPAPAPPSTGLDLRSGNVVQGAGPIEAAVFSGYDSAWTKTNKGAIASLRLTDSVLSLVPPVTAGFGEAISLLDEQAAEAQVHVVAIDQPLIVPNLTGRRPVDGAVSSCIGKRKGGVQPANRG